MAKSDVLVRMKADTQNYDANIAKARRQLDQFKKDNLSMGGAMKQLSGNLVATAARFASVTAAVGALGAAFKSNIDTARGFEKSMSQLSSLTGMVGDDLNKLKEYAIELGSTTTLSASQVADAFKMIGSQQPQLLESGEALKAVTNNAITLAEAAGIELADAAKTLSVSINQMGGDSNNAARYINVLAAASQKGAGDIVWLGEAITKSGTTAKAVGTDYEELVANLEQLAKAGYDASTAGTALRSIIMNLEKQANQQYKPSVVGLTEAFKNLGKANLTLTEYQQIAGKMFAAQAKALADAAGEAENMKVQIMGTNTAEEQAKTNTDNLDGSLKSLASAWEGLSLHINSSNGLLRDAVDWLKDVVTWADEAYQSLEKYYNGPSGPKEDIGGNVDDKGNYIKRPANGNWAGFDAKNGTWKTGYTGAIYNSQTGQTELPEVIVNGNKRVDGHVAAGGSDKNKKTKQELTELQENQKKINDLTQEYIKLGDQSTEASKKRQEEIQKEIQLLQQRNGLLGLRAEQAQGRMLLNAGDMDKTGLGSLMSNPFAGDSKTMDIYGTLKLTLDDSTMKKVNEQINSNLSNDGKELQKEWSGAAGAISAVGQAMSSIENPAAKVMGTIAQAIATIALTYAKSLEKTFGPWDWIAAAASGAATMVSVISAIHSSTGYAEGGIIKGNTYSGDMIPANGGTIGLNAGEVVLNRAQAGVLANQLEAGGQRGGYTPSHVSGEQIWIALNAYTRRTGKGELVTWR